MAYSCLQTVNQNETHFTHRETGVPEKARFLQQQIAWPSYITFKFFISNNLISNSSINVDDIEQEVCIYGTPTAL